MIRVRVELLSAITGETKELARMHICNDGSGSPTIGSYYGYTLRGRSQEALDRGLMRRIGKVNSHQRLKLHVWHLVAKMLGSMGYGK